MSGFTIENIELATLLPVNPGPLLISGLGVEETWKAEVYAESGPTVAYLKMLEPQQVVSEVVCALTGRALGLNVPKPMLIYVERQYLPQSHKWKAGEMNRVCFGSEDAKYPSFKQVIQSQQGLTNVLVKKLVEWDGFKKTAWFDEWTANTDRHIGNLLYDGTEFWLIDHGHAFTGPTWKPGDLLPLKKVNNQLLNPAYVATFDVPAKEEWKNLAVAESLRYQALTLKSLQECGMMEEYSTAEQQSSILDFLEARAEDFMQLACDRLGVQPPLI